MRSNLQKSIGAIELSRMLGSDRKVMHASIRIGDSVIMLNDEMPDWGTFGPKSLKGSPVTVHLYVKDADAAFDQAVKAGAKVTMPLDDMFWGDRYGRWKILRPSMAIGTHRKTSFPTKCKRRWNKWAEGSVL